jgi:hypothetical protein
MWVFLSSTNTHFCPTFTLRGIFGSMSERKGAAKTPAESRKTTAHTDIFFIKSHIFPELNLPV